MRLFIPDLYITRICQASHPKVVLNTDSNYLRCSTSKAILCFGARVQSLNEVAAVGPGQLNPAPAGRVN
jgi:hypothetical protein